MTNIVLKFGGTSVLKSPTSILKIVKHKLTTNSKVYIVLSALSSITNLLHKLYNESDQYTRIRILTKIKRYHSRFIKQIKFSNTSNVRRDLTVLYEQLDRLMCCEVIQKNVKLKNIVITYGEKFSATIYGYIFKQYHLPNTVIWSEFLITTNNVYTEAFPLLDISKKNIQKLMGGFTNNLLITTGYAASNVGGHKTTLGRNGSDFTATILAASLDIKTVEIYSDVDGVLSCDPRKVPNAKLITKLNYKQMSEMCYFGASVLHPKTLIPLQNKNIDLYMKNTLVPHIPGTHIVENCVSTNQIDAITSITNTSLITIKGRGMLGICGIAYKVFKVLVDNSISTSFITQASSEQNLCISINNEYINGVLVKLGLVFKKEIELGQIDKIRVNKDISIVTVIGNNMINRVGIAGKIFTVLGKHNINILAISQGTSELSISFVVKQSDEIKALNCLHDKFI